MRYHATLNVNGSAYPVEIEPGRNLLSVLRTEVGLTGAKEGCDDSECGACMVLLDGQPVNSLLLPGAAGRRPRDRHHRGPGRRRTVSCTRCSEPSSTRAASSAGSARRAC